jgi:putative oxidoreductase
MAWLQPFSENTMALEETFEDAGKLLLRVVVGGLMLFHGVDKLLNGLDSIRADLANHGLPGAMAWGVYAGEVVAPLLILGGLWTRPAAVFYAVTILFAAILVHADSFMRLAPTGAWAAETYVFYILGSATVALLGAGRYSIRGGRSRWD